MARVAGIILRAGDRTVTAQFYRDLGLTGREHQHGGPVHYELGPMTSDAVVEVYTVSIRHDTDALMVEVESLEATLVRVLPSEDVSIIERDDMRFAYIRDPDGRQVLLMQKK